MTQPVCPATSSASHTALVHQICERSKFFESNGKCFLCAPEIDTPHGKGVPGCFAIANEIVSIVLLNAAPQENKARAASSGAEFKASDSGSGLPATDSSSRGLPNEPAAAAPSIPSAIEQTNALAPTATRRGAEPGQPAIGAPSARDDKSSASQDKLCCLCASWIAADCLDDFEGEPCHKICKAEGVGRAHKPTELTVAALDAGAVYFLQAGQPKQARELTTAARWIETSVPSSTRRLDRDDIIAVVESYFGRVRKLGGDTGECSSASLADFLLYRANTDNFDPAIAVSAIELPTDIERAWQMLEVCGVPRERARNNLARGIEVLSTRMSREDHFQRAMEADASCFRWISTHREQFKAMLADDHKTGDVLMAELLEAIRLSHSDIKQPRQEKPNGR